jgi:hypothetical protein
MNYMRYDSADALFIEYPWWWVIVLLMIDDASCMSFALTVKVASLDPRMVTTNFN